MLQTFKATLIGNKIQWFDEKPALLEEKPLQVYVTVLNESETSSYEYNEITVAALQEVEAGGGETFRSVDELFKDLDN